MTKEEAKKILTEYVKACREDDFLTLEKFTYEEVVEAMDIGAEAISVLPISSNLDEAANKFAVFYDQGTCDGIAQECFKAGVKWDREQMMKETERIPKPELTWKDIAKIDALILEANNEFAVDYSKEISREQFYTEVLNRFNKSKKKEK